ncbi:iron-containing alcohol dehydrogenase [Marinobacterium mangrovicola]|uniref:NADP-dependent alcohol dehydrogenase n=1 Tax=Marinobacterium mangrovicola TaxID=1476959 RepID=A0A4R1G9A7_9GAMM|nr:iron-containing alcohol dehydrogenase [Marinobacterium mangrovicola]TCK04248.1 NADP-dependent alcohol dehydrogenase [Marinobacterium mangrovicola]
MDNFNFWTTTKIIFGAGEIASLKNEIPAGARVLITYGGGSIKKNGIFEQVTAALDHVTWFEFGGIEANPHYQTCIRALDLVKTEHIDFMLAVGGGSVIDATKFIAAAAKYEGDPWDIISSFGGVVTDALPLGCVLTLAATGSEMNGTSVVTRTETQDKLFFRSELVRPKFSILDPETTYSLPPRQVGNGVVDSFVHVLEQYVTFPANAKVQDRFSEGLLSTIIEEGPKALHDPENYDVRANLMWSATMALNGLLATGTPGDWASHLIGQELTGLYGLDHGQTLAIMIPAIWTYKLEQKREKLVQYGQRVWHIQETNPNLIAQQAIELTREFFESMGVKTRLSDYDLDEKAIPEVIAKLKEHQFVTLGEHGDITPEDAAEILKLAL